MTETLHLVQSTHYFEQILSFIGQIVSFQLLLLY